MTSIDLILTLIIAACSSAAIYGMIKRTKKKCASCSGCDNQKCSLKKEQSLRFKLVKSDNCRS
ncbi:FeoB-associated Cys-rich membrane protein [Succinatimonas hippei]|uniref:FeoB-associated Cys-rich membrane protein n=1 Tax=Succinatimonas hippei TaxID=626938 RepID=UPI0034E95F87